MSKNDTAPLQPLTTNELITQKSIDAETTPGFGATFSPSEAEMMGAFEENALTETDVLNATEESSDEDKH